MSSTTRNSNGSGFPSSRSASSAATTTSTAPSSRSAAASIRNRQRNDGQYSSNVDRQRPQMDPDSWVEVTSHPSSVSSIGEEIDITGLQVGSSSRPRRRHPQEQPHARQTAAPGRTVAGGSSQEEYDETESEEDHVLTSSTENVLVSANIPRQTPLRQAIDPNSSDDDENATALGRRPPEPFRPQPNAFTHPPSHLLHRHSTSAAMPQHSRRPSFSRRSHTRADRRTPNFMSPNYQADNDAALRASLTTLLSCAAAARSLPKEGEKELGERAAPVNNSQPVALRFAAESELMAPSPPPPYPRDSTRAAQTKATSPSRAAGEKIKRAATPTPPSKAARATKKKKTFVSEDALISPTLLTWVVSAGVVVLVSVVGFGAGYVIGREAGRQEALGSLGGAGNLSAAAADSGSCGREVLRSSGGTLRRFRWGSGMGRSVMA